MRQYIKLTVLFLFSINTLFNQTTSQFKQQNEIVSMIKNQVYSIIELGTELKSDQFGVWVEAELVGKPLPFKSVDEPEVVVPDFGGFEEILTGKKPTIPGGSKTKKPEANKTSSVDYYISGLVIRIYLDEDLESINLVQINIKALIEEQLTGVLCEDCIEFKLKKMDSMTGPVQPVIDKYEELYDSLRRAILVDKLTARDSIIALYTDQINEHVQHLQEQDSIKQAAERERMLRLEANERKYRQKQDSLYVLTSIKLDEAVRGRIQSEENTKKELLDVIKMQIQGDTSQINVSEYSDETQSSLFSKRPVMAKKGLSTQMWLMIVALILLMVILLIMVMRNKEPVYLKPKEEGPNTPPPHSVDTAPSAEASVNPYVPTQANENDEVLRSELQSLRQSAVSMSVSEKAGANQIVKDWLDDGEDTPQKSAENASDDSNINEDKK